jgi:predicted TIM-barrel fold metal-dependent hydrolase
LDALDVGVQVLYTTLFLEEVTMRPEVDAALCSSYNRWLADRCADTAGRLRWVALLPYTSISDALAELTWAKEHGACGIYKRGIEAGDRSVSDPYFFDLYAAAVDHDLPLCLHAATAWTPISRNTTSVRVSMLGAMANISAFQSLVSSKVPERFPGLRVGFIESGSAWLPFILPALATTVGRSRREELLEHAGDSGWARAMRELRLFVTSELQEDLGYLVDNVGDDTLMIGSDYSHSDRSAVKNACTRMFERDDVGKDTAVKMTNTNAAEFYGIEGY